VTYTKPTLSGVLDGPVVCANVELKNKAHAHSVAMRFLYMVFLDMTPFGVKNDAYKPSGQKTRREARFRNGGVDILRIHIQQASAISLTPF